MHKQNFKREFPSAETTAEIKNMEKKVSPPIIIYAEAVLNLIELLNRTRGRRQFSSMQCLLLY